MHSVDTQSCQLCSLGTAQQPLPHQPSSYFWSSKVNAKFSEWEEESGNKRQQMTLTDIDSPFSEVVFCWFFSHS